MKLSKKLKTKLKKNTSITLTSIALVTLTLATLKLADISMPLKELMKVGSRNIQGESKALVTIAEDGAIVCDSIVQGVRDCDLQDGNYIFRVTGMVNGTKEVKDYAVELINYYDDVTYSLAKGETSKTISLGDTTTEYKMLVVKYHKDLTIDSGVTLTATNVSNLTYKKGMYLCVIGNLYNNGTISMTARGTYNQEGENVYLWKNADASFEYVPAVGGTGAPRKSYNALNTSKAIAGTKGTNGANRSTGGGGSGGLWIYRSYIQNATGGATGTSYSGGSGGGGVYRWSNSNTSYASTVFEASNAKENGGKGGQGFGYQTDHTNAYANGGGGGAGNPIVANQTTGTRGTMYSNVSAKIGTGGLLVIYTQNLANSGSISSNGSAGGIVTGNGGCSAGGAGSGGGSVNIFAKTINNTNTIQALGGTKGTGSGTSGGAGGEGTVTFTKVGTDLNYSNKSIKLKVGDSYQINALDIKYIELENSTEKPKIGNIKYTSIDKTVASVDTNGNIVALKEGTTKIEIKDETNGISTFMYVKVTNTLIPMVDSGNDFTIALKQNGTVWGYGLNDKGQLGIENNENQTKPVQVLNLNNIMQIATGYGHAIALDEQGNVYAWGDNSNGQLGDGTTQDSNKVIKINGLSNIVKIDAYDNLSIALDENGKLYVWGKDYSSIPMRVILTDKVVDISGKIILTEKGFVYYLSDLENRIETLNNIAKISCGFDHYLALSTNGEVYSWGNNTYGQLGTSFVTSIPKKIANNVVEISAGKYTTILKTEDGKVYRSGNNADGQIGLESVTKSSELQELLEVDNIESISAGEGTNTSVVDTDGFIWNTGLNTVGQLGNGITQNKTVYEKIGDVIVYTDLDEIYLDVGEKTTITPKLINEFNLKVELLDNNPDNFTITSENTKIFSISNREVTSNAYGITNIIIKHNETGNTKVVKAMCVKIFDDLVQGIRDTDLPDGDYPIRVKDVVYQIELINYYDDMIYEQDESLGDDTTDYKTLVVKYHKNLTISEGVTLTAKTVNNLTYKKGMYLCVLGNIYNNGRISMTARGTYNQEGENVYLWKNIDSTYEYVPAMGGSGASKKSVNGLSTNKYIQGTKGTNGNNRETAGGGSGGVYLRYSSIQDATGGATGTSYSGGSGGGGVYRWSNSNTSYASTVFEASNAQTNGGQGGQGFAYQADHTNAYANGGGSGAGNPIVANQTTGTRGVMYSNIKAENGTGGLLILYTNTLYNHGKIESNGSAGGTVTGNGGCSAAGAGSGGGSINIFAKTVSEMNITEATGGTGGKGSPVSGGSGGDGTVTINELGSILNYRENTIVLKTKEQYQIDKTKLTYTKLNDIQTESLVVGNLKYEGIDSNIISVDENGMITAKQEGVTTLTITDETNGYCTNVVVKVINENACTQAQIEEGNDFTVTLKENGTVWTYGKNDQGQLGNSTKVDSNFPIQVIMQNGQELQNVKDIGAGNSIAIAVTNEGKVYTWGANRQVATLKEDISDIVKVEAYEGTFYAISIEGKVYTWNKENETVTQIENEGKEIVEVSGKIMLDAEGFVYHMDAPTEKIPYLSNIINISYGVDSYACVSADGFVFTAGTGDKGQLGNGKQINTKEPVIVKTKDGYLSNVYKVSVGNKMAMAVTLNGDVYVWGDNTNSKIGISDKLTTYATKITKVQDKQENEIPLKAMENVAAGKNKSSLSDVDGFVYSVGLNTNGQLGTNDNKARDIYTLIGEKKVTTNEEPCIIEKQNAHEISILLENSFNLKSDLDASEKIAITNTNENIATITQKENIDNRNVINKKDFVPNYSIIGNKIGRVNLVATSQSGYTKNIWVNVVNSEDAKVSAKVENGKNYTVALRSDGTVWSFGYNEQGQLGLGNNENKNFPKKIEIPQTIVDISVGENHTLLLSESGKVYSFGLNSKGQLGLGNTTTYKTPIEIPNLSNIEKVIAKGNTSFAIDKMGRVYAFGEKYSKIPTLLSIDKNVIDITPNYYLADDGIVRKLSDNEEIHLSLNEYDPSSIPVYEEERVVQISEGTDHILMLGQSGKIYSYGKNVYGQLGDNTTIARQNNISTAVKIKDGSILENVSEVSAGDKYSIATTKDGKVYTFGINQTMQLGVSNDLNANGIQESLYAILKEDITEVERVEAGYTHTAVYKQNGEIYTWGQGVEGELGNGTNHNIEQAQLVGKNIIQTNVSSVVLEAEETFDIDAWIDYFNLFTTPNTNITYEILNPNLAIVNSTNGELMTIKEGRTTVLAREKATNKIAIIDIRILAKGTRPENINTTIEPQVETNGNHTIMLKVDGTVWTYGIGNYGELGNGKKEVTDEPVQAIFPKGTIITKIAAGENHCLALDNEGNVWSWGRNEYYQLGNSTKEYILTPTKIEGLTNIKQIDAGNHTSFAITKEGELYGFGLNANGEAGIGSYTNRITPTKAKFLTDVIAVKAGKNHTVVLKSTGEVLVTGSNLYGELGQNDTSIRKVNEFKKVNLENVVRIATGDGTTTVLLTDGNVYTWGSNIYKELGIGNTNISVGIPTKVENLKNIQYIDGGKGYNLAINENNEVYVVGENRVGQLGNGQTTNLNTYSKLSTIQNVIYASSGKGYTTFLKQDGTVWACGDYTNGDETIKSKTKSAYPVQVGNDETGFHKTEIILPINTQKDLSANCSYAFNLINLEDNFTDLLEYSSLNEEIASVNEKGNITGNKIGTTRIKAKSTGSGKIYSILVKVVDGDSIVIPKVEAGENFVSVLKADGTIWTSGYNADGRLGLGNYLTKDIPEKTNILSTYQDLSVGKDFMVALRSDGSVWTVGNNDMGQCGSGNTNNKNKLTQALNLENIKQIAAGKDFAIAIDEYSIVYGWGNNDNGQLGNHANSMILKPTQIQILEERVVDIAAGEDESVFVTAKGRAYGYGNRINGTIEGVHNVIKAEVGKDAIYLLTSSEEVYQYKEGVLEKVALEGVIDISAKEDSILLQTFDEKTYVMGDNTYGQLGTNDKIAVSNPILTANSIGSTYGVSTGYRNTYIIQNTGNVYAVGYNEYGSLGNGTRKESLEYTLVGNRNFTVKPQSAIMQVGNVEEIQITAESFNIFNQNVISAEEYEYTTDNEDSVTVQVQEEKAKIQAIAPGTSHIDVTDKLTNEKITLTRIVLENEKDRIKEISLNSQKAELTEDSDDTNMKYEVKVVTDENVGTLKIVTNDLTDRISIDGGNTWSYNGTLNQEIELINKTTQIPIIVGIQNNEGEYVTQQEYTLEVEKISNDTQIKQIKITSTNEEGSVSEEVATPVSLTRYETVVEEGTILSIADVIANHENAFVSIDGQEYTKQEQQKNIVMDNSLTKEVKIAVKSEAGQETEYTLVIYKQNELTKLSSLTVNDIEAEKVSEGTYAIYLNNDVTIGKTVARIDNSLAEISIDDNKYTKQQNSKEIELLTDTTIATIKVKAQDQIKEYTLYIYKETKEQTDLSLYMLMINGTVIRNEEDKVTFIAYLPSSETKATLRAISTNSNTTIKILDGSAVGDYETQISLDQAETTCEIILSNEKGEKKTYYAIIRKADADASIGKIVVSKDDYEQEATKVGQNEYKVKVPNTFENIDVTAITGYTKAQVQIEDNAYETYKTTKNISLVNDTTIITIKALSEDGTNEQEYTLIIEKTSNNTELFELSVDGQNLTMAEDGNYYYTLLDAKTNVEVTATAQDENARVQIGANTYESKTTTKEVMITAKKTTETIRVKAEDGTIKQYHLIIEGLPDDTNISKVTVNGKEAKYIEGKNRYEIRSEQQTFQIEVTLSDLLASLELGTNEKAIGSDVIEIEKQGQETILTVKVTSQNGLEQQEYTIAILEKSNNTNISKLQVNNQTILLNTEGKYVANLKHDETKIKVDVTAEDEYAIASIDGQTNQIYSMTKEEMVQKEKTNYSYNVQIQAEDGTIATYELEVNILEGNTNILEVLVGEDEATFENAILQEDGSYYLKTNRIEEAFVKVNLESENSNVSMNGENGNIVKVLLKEEIVNIPILVTAQDGTIKQTILCIEKKSNNTSIKEVTGTQVINAQIEENTINVYVDEDANEVDLKILLNNELASLKLEEETDYTISNITRTIDLSNYAENNCVIVNVNVKAEDGTLKDYTMCIYKQANLELESVKVNSNQIKYNEEEGRYYEIVANSNKPVVEITAKNEKQIIQLISKDGSVIANGTGNLLTTLTLPELESSYCIRITSHNGEAYGVQEYDLVIRQKSQETGIMYVKVDSLGTTLNDTGLIYSSKVSGKVEYPVEIKLKDSKAKVKLEDMDGNILKDYTLGILTTNVPIADGKTKEFKIVVQSENGEEKEYSLVVERVSSNTDITEITVTDYDTDGTTEITKPVTIYDEATKTYKIVVKDTLSSSKITVKAASSFTNIEMDSQLNALESVTYNKSLSGLGVNTVSIKLTAADGSVETRYLEIIQLSSEIGILKVSVDGVEVTPNEAGDYETTLTDEKPTAQLSVTLLSETTKVSINEARGVLKEATVNVEKGSNRQILVPIVVTAEDGTTYTYYLTLNIISHNAEVSHVIVDSEEAILENEEYTAYIDKNAQTVEVKVNASVSYATVSHVMEDGSKVSNTSNLTFQVDTNDLTQNEFETSFSVIAEDGTLKSYVVHLIRKSDDATIKVVQVNGITLEPNVGKENYLDGTYYIAVVENTNGQNIETVMVEANNDFAKVEFNQKNSNNILEQNVTLGEEKITAIPVKITSQQGTTYETVIYIEKVSDNHNLDYVKVNNEEAEKTQEENTFISYIYDTLSSSNIEIKAENENAAIVRTTSQGEIYLNENGVSNKGKGILEMSIPTEEALSTIYFKIISENGVESEVYTLNIEKMSTDTSLKEIYVNGNQIQQDENGTYHVNILDTDGNPEVKVITTNALAHVRIALGDEYLQTAQDKVTMSASKQTVIPITVRSQSGITKVTYLYINKISTNIALSTLTLDDKQANSYNENIHTYTFLVEQQKTEFDLFVIAESDYTNLEYEGVDYGASLKTIVNMPVEEQGKTLVMTAKSESGNTQEYKVEIIRKSEEVGLEYVKVNDITREPDEENGDTYTVMIPKLATSTSIEVKTRYPYATIRLGDNQVVKGQDKSVIDCSNLKEERIIVPVVVTAADGQTVKTYTIILIRAHTQIQGSIVTQNAQDIHHAEVSVYLTSDTRKIDDKTNPRQVISQATTNDDGNFLMELEEEGTYDIVVTKQGYLSYTITDIIITEGEKIDVGSISLLAGDIISDGEIKLNDLVNLNDNIGVVITEENKIFDLNEDGNIDNLDRQILKKNYAKRAEKVMWVNPNAVSLMSLRSEKQDFILPMACEYMITSGYGYRIHPITGENTLHAGIDLVGTHHTEILAVADGEVTYAGIQSGYGNCVEIKHIVNGETIYSFYAHLSEIDVTVGQSITQGEVIGKEGGDPETDPNPGNSTGHHLHFELRSASGSGHSIDPNTYIAF
ncbi:MAG: cadherin-like beta sandwich domain-containing protein [Clostridia bacterium]|nr:cadherin-like beta sandwich domain-containing protein [Clostridia bacterium]